MIAVIFAVAAVMVALWGGNILLEERALRRMYATGERLRGKMLRHAPTGAVGRMLGVTIHPARWLGWYRCELRVQLITSRQLMTEMKEAGSPLRAAILIAEGMIAGRIPEYPVAELVAALPEEILAFHEGGREP